MEKGPRFTIQTLEKEKAETYWKNIKAQGLPNIVGEYPRQNGHPIELESSLVQEIRAGAKAAHDILIDEIRQVGGVSSFMQDRPVRFGETNISTPEINKQLDERLSQGYGLPITYDVLLAAKHGMPHPQVLELQTSISYETSLTERLRAAGHDPKSEKTRFGNKSPEDVYRSFPAHFTKDNPIVVLDTEPFDATRVDKIGMQKMVGGANRLPISPLDIEGKDEKGYYYHPYIKHPSTPFAVVKDATGTPVKDTSKVLYAKSVLSRMTQFDLTALWEKTKDDPEKTKLITEFLTDGNLDWIWHPTWQHIGDKSLMPKIRSRLHKAGNPVADQFVPIYSSGQTVDQSGLYMHKPADAQHGVNQSIKRVSEGEQVQVEEGMIYQALIKPYQVLTHMPGRYTAPMRSDTQQAMRALDEEHPDDMRPLPSNQLEIRCLIPPYWQDEPVGRFMTRLAPRRESPTSLAKTKTNVGTIHTALHKHLRDKGATHIYYPYGNAPALISDAQK